MPLRPPWTPPTPLSLAPLMRPPPAGWRICRCRRWMRNTGVRPNAWMMWSTIPCCACGLVAGYHGRALQPDAVLSHYGFPVRLARTGLRAKRLPMDDKTVVDVWSEACGQLNALARPRGATPGPAGYMEFQRTVERFRVQMRTQIMRRLTGRRKMAHPTQPQPAAPQPVECR